MLISFEEIINILQSKNIKINGCLHIGAHECEELPFYQKLGLNNNQIVWIEAIPVKVEQSILKGIPNVYNYVITNKDDTEVVFKITNNVQSSSILDLGTHLEEHPGIYYVNKFITKSITIDSFFERNKIDASKCDFWNLDIQGAELLALKGAVKSLKYVKVLYLEVNEKELYKNCGLITEIDEFLSNFHFKRVVTNMTKHGWGDALYILERENKQSKRPLVGNF